MDLQQQPRCRQPTTTTLAPDKCIRAALMTPRDVLNIACCAYAACENRPVLAHDTKQNAEMQAAPSGAEPVAPTEALDTEAGDAGGLGVRLGVAALCRRVHHHRPRWRVHLHVWSARVAGGLAAACVLESKVGCYSNTASACVPPLLAKARTSAAVSDVMSMLGLPANIHSTDAHSPICLIDHSFIPAVHIKCLPRLLGWAAAVGAGPLPSCMWATRRHTVLM